MKQKQPKINGVKQPAVANIKAAAFVLPKWLPLLVIIVTALIYSKGITNGLTTFDDDFYITNNPFLRDFTLHGVKAIFTSFYTSNYHPFTTLTFLLEYNNFGLNPIPYHTLNILLHLLNTWLVYKVVIQLSGKPITAFVVMALFALHPLHVESVAWVSERKDVLYAAFYLSALLVYFKYVATGFKVKYYIFCLLLFSASLFSKSAAVSLPVLLIAIDIYKGRKISLKSLITKAPFFLLSLLFGILNIMAQSTGGSINNILTTYGIVNHIFLFASGLSFYFIKLVAPFNLCAMHFFPEMHNGLIPWLYYGSIPFLLVLALLVIRNSVYRRELIFGVSFFLITIAVMLQIVSFGSAMAAERYTYLSYIGLFYISGQWVADNIEKEKRKTSITIGFSLLIVLFSYLTWQRIGFWKDSMVLLNDLTEKYPNISVGYWMRGNLEKESGDLKEAMQDYTQAIILNPKDDDSYYNRGKIYDDLGNPKNALQDYTQAILLNPKLPDAYNNRGWAYFETGDTALAMKDYNQAISINPKYAEAYNNRGWAYYRANNLNAALNDYTQAITVKPEFLKPYYNRAVVLAITGSFVAAVADYTFIINTVPDAADAYFYRGLNYLNQHDTTKACNDWKKAKYLGFEKSGKVLQDFCR